MYHVTEIIHCHADVNLACTVRHNKARGLDCATLMPSLARDLIIFYVVLGSHSFKAKYPIFDELFMFSNSLAVISTWQSKSV